MTNTDSLLYCTKTKRNIKSRIHFVKSFVLFIIILTGLTTKSNAQTTLTVVDVGGAFPTTLLGNYTQNGTLNGKPAYQGPNGYWLYWGTDATFGPNWYVGTPEGNTNLNGTTGFAYPGSQATPPLFVNYASDQNSAGRIQIQTAPGSPTATAASSITNLGFTANWNSSTGATGYRLDVSTNSSFSSFVSGYNGKNVSNVNSYSVNSGLSANTTYYYRVRAYNGVGTSSSSNTINLTTLVNPPGAPTANAASSITTSGFTANWSSSSGATGYKLDVSTNSSFSSFVTVYNSKDVGNVTTYSVSGLSAHTNYYYRVKAYNTSGTSSASNSISLTTSNNPPTVSDISKSVNEDNTFTFSLANFTGVYNDADSDPLSKVKITSLASHGTLKLSGSAVTVNQEIAAASLGNLTYVPNLNYNGNDSFNYNASDGIAYASSGAAVNITVNAVNDPPTLTATASDPTFTEGGSAKILFSSTSVSTVESAQTILKLILTVTNVNDGSNEILGIDGTDVALTNGNSATTATNGMSASVSVTGTTATVTISKAAGISTAAMQTLVDGITYKNTSNNPNTSNRVVTLTSIQDNGGISNGGSDTSTLSVPSTVTVIAVNNPPVLASIEGTAIGYTENDPATQITNTISVSDVDNTTQASAAVSITGNFAGAEDVLSFTNDGSTMGNISASYNSGTGVLAMTSSGATATLAQWQSALRAVKYRNTSDNPSTAARTVSFTVNDGTDNSTAVTRQINITAVNDAPVLAAIEGGALSFTEGDAATNITSSLTASDVDNTNLASAVVQITSNYVNGEDILSYTQVGSITGSFDALTGKMTLTGSDTKANYQAALRAVKYQNTSSNPSTAPRTVSFTVNDGSLNSSTVVRNLNIISVDNPPVLAGIETSTLSYTEGDAAKVITSTITVSDVDNTTLISAKVRLGNNFSSGEDVLGFTDQNGITGSYNSSSGVLTLTGSASIASYQAALRSVTYNNTSNNPSTAARTISFTVNDGAVNSGAVTRGISIASVNAPPALTAAADNPAFTEGGGAKGLFTNTSVSTVESGQKIIKLELTVTNVNDGTNEILNIDGSGVALTNGNSLTTPTNSMSASVNVTGTTAAVTISNSSGISTAAAQTLVDNISYKNTSDNPNTSNRVVTLTSVQDNGGTANGGADTESLSIASTVTVISVNDPPTLTATADNPTFNEGGSAKGLFTNTSVSTVESGQKIIKLALTITNIDFGSNEILNIDGSDVALKGGNSVTTKTNNMSVNVSVTGTTAAVTLSNSTGISTAAAQTLVDGITYKNTSIDPSTDNRVVTLTSIQDNGGTANGGQDSSVLSVSSTVKVVAVDNPPVLAGIETTPLSYSEGDAATAITSTINISDPDNTTISSAKVSITGGFSSGEDVLGFTNQNGITGSYNAATGVLTLLSSAGINGYQAALRSVTYKNTSSNPSTAIRTISFTVNDGNLNSNTETRSITVTAVDNPPALSDIESSPINFTEGNAAVQITNTITVTDDDNANMSNAAVQITSNYVSSEDVLSYSKVGNVEGTFDASTGKLTLTGSGTKADYQAALRAVKYQNTSGNPSTATRTISFTVNDGTVNSAAATRNINIAAVDNAPVLASIEAVPLSYTENDPATRITDSITVTDTDNTKMSSAVVQISGNYRGDEDVLSFTNVSGITGKWDPATGTMTLSGSAPKADYQTALRSVAYFNTSNNPDTSLRTVSFSVNDGDSTSNIAEREIKVKAVDDPPIISFQFRPLTTKENETLTLTISQLYPFISDPDNPDSTLSVTYSYKGNDLVLISKTDTSITIKPKENWYGLDTVTVKVSDGILSTTASFAVDVLFVNNPPRFDNLPASLTVMGGDTTKVNIFNLVSDVETPDDSLQYNFTATNDSLLYNFNPGSGVLKLYSIDGYDGTTKLNIGLTDKNGGTADTLITVKVEGKITGIKALAGMIPKDYKVYQNYPNPFNPSTIIRYGLPQESSVVIKIYNILGQQVSTLFSGTQRAGYYEKTFDASRLSSGIYIYTVVAESTGGSRRFSIVKKMILLK